MNSAPRILVVEDDEAVLYYVRIVLERYGYEVLGALDGLTGLMMVAEHRPDLVICDYYMPDLNGLELVEKVRIAPETASIPVVVSSVDGSTTLKRRCLSSGAHAFLEKPFTPEQLMAVVRATLT